MWPGLEASLVLRCLLPCVGIQSCLGPSLMVREVESKTTWQTTSGGVQHPVFIS
ncbi:hypothetical protein J437_LFUL002190 [Ladona fulva]|uniref:Uncharacterized protein n=1 Tax=Ladona fulva TaxID=123851 RepID=A0A8K0NRX7_LADFU|nr:hypothetical protein J437_LFUL002190 [Ladona fulva]